MPHLFYNNLGNYGPVLIVILLLHSEIKCDGSGNKTYHLTLNLMPHYPAKIVYQQFNSKYSPQMLIPHSHVNICGPKGNVCSPQRSNWTRKNLPSCQKHATRNKKHLNYSVAFYYNEKGRLSKQTH